jgi:serine/threonine protein kinase
MVGNSENPFFKGKAPQERFCQACGTQVKEPHACPSGRTPQSADMLDMRLGQLFGRHYEVMTPVGDGTLSKVYKVRHQKNKSIFAMKIMKTGLFQGENNLKKFREEALNAQRLHHSNVIGTHDYGIDDGLCFLIVDYIDAISLAKTLSTEGHFNTRRAIKILSDIAAGLHYAHKEGVIHGDLKPSNILMVPTPKNPDGIKLVDFGLGKILNVDQILRLKVTASGQSHSIFYMSPERCKGKKLDARSDVYSLGCLMYEILLGRPPFVGESPAATLKLHTDEAPPSFAEVRSDVVQPKLESIVLKCLAKAPSSRYRSVEELEKNLFQLTLDEDEVTQFGPIDKAMLSLRRLDATKRGQWVRLIVMAAGVLAVIAICWLAYPTVNDRVIMAGKMNNLSGEVQKHLDTGEYQIAEFYGGLDVEKEKASGHADLYIAALNRLKETYILMDKPDQSKKVDEDINAEINKSELKDSEDEGKFIANLDRYEADTITPDMKAELPKIAENVRVTAEKHAPKAMLSRWSSLLHRVIVIEQKLFGPTYAPIATISQTLATLSDKAGDYDSALKYSKDSITITEAQPDEVSLKMDLLPSFQIEAKEAMRLRRFDEAESAFNSVLTLSQKKYGDDSPEVATVHLDLAELYVLRALSQGADARAKYSSQAAAELDNLKSLYDPAPTSAKDQKDQTYAEHRMRYQYLRALLAIADDKTTEATDLLKKAIESMEALPSVEEERLPFALFQLANLYEEGTEKEQIKAIPLYKRAIVISVYSNWYDNDLVMQMLKRLSEASHQDKKDIAISAYQQKLDADIAAQKDRLIADDYRAFANYYKDRGDGKLAQSNFEQALTTIQQIYGNSSAEVCQIYGEMADFYLSQNRQSDAELSLKYASQIIREAQRSRKAEEHIDPAVATPILSKYVSLLEKGGKNDEAKSVREVLDSIQAGGSTEKKDSGTPAKK